MTRLLRFFFLMKLHPAHGLLIAAACAAVGVWTMWFDPAEIDSGLGLMLFVQMFIASTGFTSRARAGHFDPVLVGGNDRARVAAAHWIMSLIPGLAGWIILVAVGFSLGSTGAFSALAGRRAVAFAIVSMLSWIAGYRLPRGGAGIAWITLLVAMLLQHNLRFLSAAFDHGAHRFFWELGVLLVCPFLLIGNRPYISPAVQLSALALCVVALGGLCVWTKRLDVVLVEHT